MCFPNFSPTNKTASFAGQPKLDPLHASYMDLNDMKWELKDQSFTLSCSTPSVTASALSSCLVWPLASPFCPSSLDFPFAFSFFWNVQVSANIICKWLQFGPLHKKVGSLVGNSPPAPSGDLSSCSLPSNLSSPSAAPSCYSILLYNSCCFWVFFKKNCIAVFLPGSTLQKSPWNRVRLGRHAQTSQVSRFVENFMVFLKESHRFPLICSKINRSSSNYWWQIQPQILLKLIHNQMDARSQ